MRLWRVILVAVLVYVGLDLSIATMPGAFVFDAADSVESLQTRRERRTVAAVPAPDREATVVRQPRVAIRDRRIVLHWHVPPAGHPLVSVLPRATLSPGQSPEDPY